MNSIETLSSQLDVNYTVNSSQDDTINFGFKKIKLKVT